MDRQKQGECGMWTYMGVVCLAKLPTNVDSGQEVGSGGDVRLLLALQLRPLLLCFV